MLSTLDLAERKAIPPQQLLTEILDTAEVGMIVLDHTGRPLYMNDSARDLLRASTAEQLPEWTAPYVASLIQGLDSVQQRIERWEHNDLALRVRGRLLERTANIVLELRATQGQTGQHVADQLARGLHLPLADAKLLVLLWRGMSNDEIAQTMGVRVGTIKSRLFRLYQKLGVKRRPAAVLRAAEILAS